MDPVQRKELTKTGPRMGSRGAPKVRPIGERGPCGNACGNLGAGLLGGIALGWAGKVPCIRAKQLYQRKSSRRNNCP